MLQISLTSLTAGLCRSTLHHVTNPASWLSEFNKYDLIWFDDL